MRTAPRREPRLELHLQLPGRDMVLGLGKLDVRLRMLELDEVDMAEDVFAVRVLVALAFSQGFRFRPVPVKAHNWIKQRIGSG
jgi:hypothetical protein